MSSTLGLKDTQPHDTSRGFQSPHCEVETSQCDFRVSVVHLLDLTYTLQCALRKAAPAPIWADLWSEARVSVSTSTEDSFSLSELLETGKKGH